MNKPRLDQVTLQAASAKTSDDTSQKWTGEVRYIARQPILNLKGEVHGYRLLFRDPDPSSSREGDQAARTMLDNAVLFGLDRFTNGLPAFIDCTQETLTSNMVNVLAPDRSVLVIPASLEPASNLVKACRELRKQGYRLALDDFSGQAKLQPIMNLANYLQINFSEMDDPERLHLQRIISVSTTTLIANKVATQEDYRRASASGFTLFQGEYISHPILLKKRKIPANRVFHFKILQELMHVPVDIPQVSKLVMRDAALTFRLLRLANSPLCAVQQEVRSIEAAILFLGEDTFRRVITVAVLSELNASKPPEVLHMALQRARFCEQAAQIFDLEPAEQYLLGLLSMLPALVDRPMEEVLSSLPLRDPIRGALQQTMNAERSLLTWLESHERGDWEACDAIVQACPASRGLSAVDAIDRQRQNEQTLNQTYAESVAWAAATLSQCV
jgi:c-di-GMP phosphodiesterase